MNTVTLTPTNRNHVLNIKAGTIRFTNQSDNDTVTFSYQPSGAQPIEVTIKPFPNNKLILDHIPQGNCPVVYLTQKNGPDLLIEWA